jgi:hypothetical protein
MSHPPRSRAVVTTRNGPKVIRCPPSWRQGGAHLAICWKTRVSGATRPVGSVTMRPVRKISREVVRLRTDPSETTRRTPLVGDEMVRPTRRRVEAGRNDRPAEQICARFKP